MIKKVSTLPKLSVECMSLAKIFAQSSAFDGSALENDFWVQEADGKITAVISMDGGSMNVYCDGADFAELKEFISALAPSQIFTEYENAKPLGIKCDRVRNMLTYKASGASDKTDEFTLKELYGALDKGSDVDIHLPSFEVFAPDVSHRLRHGGAKAVVKDYGAALAFTYSDGAVMTGIALSKEYRGKGLGKKLLTELLSKINGDFFVAANDTNKEFYLRNGFALSGAVCFGRME